ncbi:MAG: type I glyceraldehyde-3-phosphate dehydrogenase [Candidatus Melainabacteria bacterium GWF2_32_7]|nr:MAG: type I glyceraldehyde-3-phosphate dehydrogenase [Candidatus Melainabacteria bacterium GWF2_32_7]
MSKVGINGFGRIGRNTLRAAIEKKIFDKLDIVAINDPGMNLEMAAILLEYDTVMGRFKGEVKVENDSLIVNGKKLRLFAEKNPADIPWKDLGVDIIIESSGFFTDANNAKAHIDPAGAKKVIISAPAKNEDVTINLGVNENMYDSSRHNIVSMASCTTNCLATVAKVLLKEFGIVKGMMTTDHAYTSSQKLLDAPDHKHIRRGRAAAQNIIPASTGASEATELVLPELRGKLDAIALRVPVADASIIDFVVLTEKSVTVDSVNQAFKRASEGELRGIMGYSEKPLVSSDFIGSHYSSIVDSELTRTLGDNMVKVLAWYDNEMGYSTRLAEFAVFMSERL